MRDEIRIVSTPDQFTLTGSDTVRPVRGAALDHVGACRRRRFDRVYGGWWGRVVIHDGAAAVRRSADRYLARLRGERPA
jgi:hypothetical protein